ncbi:hypothetical protein CDN99_16210 [Roseateles aquatilis]|uniref:HTH cro/C1-type domain-containing protein n=1 Tax=Roseateles aquatilis TaxID=431061 RepID=A0A246J780_9BURK|nr:XRE family transcriptional regulator [Roseateles aquatilis]OWQ88402.1 hypothetical protein CDN99_16210 [Roseateles aquatilis]
MPLTQAALGQRIRSARERCHLTQERLGESIGLSRVAINQIESGARAVSSLELDRLAFAVGRDIREFFADDFTEHVADQDALSALFRATPQLADQGELLSALQESMALGHQVSQLEQMLGIDRAQLRAAIYELPAPTGRWDAVRQGQRVAADERQRLGLGIAPIGDLADVLEGQGVRTGAVPLPENISGLTLCDPRIGVFVVANLDHAPLRRRFSYAHEYAHVLVDRNRRGTLSRSENRQELIEVRANAFAADFLMPEDGVEQFVRALGKGAGSRNQAWAFDGDAAIQAEQRSSPGSQELQLYDVARLAHHFGVSRLSALYRVKNLRLVGEADFNRLKAQEESGGGPAIAEFLRASEPLHGRDEREDFRRRFLGLGLEAFRRDEITKSKLFELAAMVGVTRSSVQNTLTSVGME